MVQALYIILVIGIIAQTIYFNGLHKALQKREAQILLREKDIFNVDSDADIEDTLIWLRNAADYWLEAKDYEDLGPVRLYAAAKVES